MTDPLQDDDLVDPSRPYDLLLQGGRVLDPDSGRDGQFDVAFTADRVAAIQTHIDPAMSVQVVQVNGAMVVPGLIDPHAHVCEGISIGVHPDVAGLSRGTTTVVDGGTCGANTFGAFKRVMASSRTRTLAWLHISSIGLVDTRIPECSLPVHDERRRGGCHSEGEPGHHKRV